ncbi:unnamed protein product [Dicrocoelium dendriticum]|nr:unnamed protein product [Dicrocoelium dendriticum]
MPDIPVPAPHPRTTRIHLTHLTPSPPQTSTRTVQRGPSPPAPPPALPPAHYADLSATRHFPPSLSRPSAPHTQPRPRPPRRAPLPPSCPPRGPPPGPQPRRAPPPLHLSPRPPHDQRDTTHQPRHSALLPD